MPAVPARRLFLGLAAAAALAAGAATSAAAHAYLTGRTQWPTPRWRPQDGEPHLQRGAGGEVLGA